MLTLVFPTASLIYLEGVNITPSSSTIKASLSNNLNTAHLESEKDTISLWKLLI